jgi:ABC-type glycerol-3-phosphate transport system permease component
MAASIRLGMEHVRRVPLVLFVALYTVVTGGPLLWVAMMSLRTTTEIFKDPYGLPSPVHW